LSNDFSNFSVHYYYSPESYSFSAEYAGICQKQYNREGVVVFALTLPNPKITAARSRWGKVKLRIQEEMKEYRDAGNIIQNV